VVRDETLSLSKTHFEIEVTADAVSVLDRHSTNGVTIVRDGTRIAADAGVRLPLEPGDALEIGDRIVTYRGRG
jgi:predicted component of type VI protein secretion system